MRAIPSDQRLTHRPDESAADFETRIRKTLYERECSEGSRFRIPGYSSKQLQQVWSQAA